MDVCLHIVTSFHLFLRFNVLLCLACGIRVAAFVSSSTVHTVDPHRILISFSPALGMFYAARGKKHKQEVERRERPTVQ